MIPKVLIEEADIPGGGKRLSLYQQDKDFYINAGREELMSSRMHFSEDELARLAMEKIKYQPDPQVLIGGLGMGYTLRAALDNLPKKAKITVAEIVPAVVRWNRTVLAGLANDPLSDERVEIQEQDVAGLIKCVKNRYNGIILDVDNGPAGLSKKSNDWFYQFEGLKAIKSALKVGGVLAIWSAYFDQPLPYRLKSVGFHVEEIKVRSRPGNKGSHHYVWIATKRNP